MPVPPPERVVELLSDAAADAGCEIDLVTVSAAGRRSVVRVVVDSEAGLDLDAVAALTRAFSAVLDVDPSVGEAAYTLEVTTPGTDRPLTLERHWRRSRGRRALVRLADEELHARIGTVADGTVELVLPDRRDPQVRTVALAEVEHAVVEVEFSTPDPRELALSGAPRVVPASVTDPGDDDLHDDDLDDDDLDDLDDEDEEDR